MASSLNKVRSGKFIGNGADKKVVLGFQPKKVEIYNVTDGVDYAKTSEMATNFARKEVIAGTKTYAASVQIDADGFTIIAAENVADKEFHYTAYESKSEY